MERIKVIDSPTGSGKTSWAIDYINSLPEDKKVIYITPFLTEVERVLKSCPDKKFTQPEAKYGEGRKIVHLLKLIREERNIVSTHSLFSNINDELITALRNSNYILVLDEVMNVVEKLDMWSDFPRASEEEKDKLTRDNIQTLLNKGFIKIDDDFKVVWVDTENPIDKYHLLKQLADRDLIYLVNGKLLLWTFPIEVFMPGVFEEIYILTFQFGYQLQAYYYNYFDLPYGVYHIEEEPREMGDRRLFRMVETFDDDYEREWIEKVRPLITIIDSAKLNKVGSISYDTRRRPVKTTLSKTWYDTNLPEIPRIQKNIINVFINFTKCKNNEKMWTCFLEHQKLFKNAKLSQKNWVPLNARATNDYANKKLLAYPINRYVNPFYVHFFSKKNIELDQDGYALSEMIQWIWRSAIRNGEPITIYIPSERMRTLLQNYLNFLPIEF